MLSSGYVYTYPRVYEIMQQSTPQGMLCTSSKVESFAVEISRNTCRVVCVRLPERWGNCKHVLAYDGRRRSNMINVAMRLSESKERQRQDKLPRKPERRSFTIPRRRHTQRVRSRALLLGLFYFGLILGVGGRGSFTFRFVDLCTMETGRAVCYFDVFVVCVAPTTHCLLSLSLFSFRITFAYHMIPMLKETFWKI